ncbi:MAG: hypothetical protein ACFNVL_02855 [Candidatus Nanoperiomorbus sp.]|jgi:hypothetical protein
MVIISLLSWWYSEGWLEQISLTKRSFIKLADKFSIGMLLRTLFAPFRQISVGEQAGKTASLASVIADKLISRLVGSVMRLVMVFVGTLALIIYAVISVLRLASWPLLPLAPVLGLILMVSVGAPWKII